MSINTKQLEEISQNLLDRFENDRYVTVTPVAGKTSGQYEVTYNVTSVIQKEDKSIQETKNHTISITIPFGFPHFPPNCKPVTPIFHPDIDEAAICIGDFWTRDESLSEVIIHIGRMISGEIYSHENAFNEDAVIWYMENSDRLPFEIVNFSAEPAPAAIVETISEETKEPEPFEIDILDDSDFDSDFDFLSLEEPQVQSEKVTIETPSADTEDVSVDNLRVLVKQKRFQELDQLLKSSPKDIVFEGRPSYEKQVKSAFSQAKKLQRQADELEHQGNPAKALEFFQEVATIVSDYPNIQESIKRTQESLELLGDWTPGSIEKSFDGIITEETEKQESHEVKKEVTFFDVKTKAKLRIVPIIITVALVVLLGVFLFPMFTEKSQLQKAQATLLKCQDLLNQSKFAAAEKKCETALEQTTGFQLLFKKKEKTLLAENIHQVLQSPKMKQGLAGNILYEGKYIHKSTYDSIISYQKSKEEGDRLFADSKWEEAIANYEEAVTLFPYIKNSSPNDLRQIKEKIILAKVNNFMETGIRFNETNDWQSAMVHLEKALSAAQNLTVDKRLAIIKKITPQISQAKFFQQIQLADTYFSTNDWQKASQHYKNALRLTNKFQMADTSLRESINEKLTRAELYTLIVSGKDAFKRGDWDTAINKYGAAVTLLKRNRTMLSRANTNGSRIKLARVMLQASIIRDQQGAAKKLKGKQYEQAIEKLQSIVTTITNSEFRDQEEFLTILQDTHSAIADVQSQKLFAELTSYLKDNYRKLFTQNFSSITPEYLKDPAVTFVKKIGDNFLFKIQCTEIGQGRPSILLMHYMYYPESKKWKFYDVIN